jgi:hypothetical protein
MATWTDRQTLDEFAATANALRDAAWRARQISRVLPAQRKLFETLLTRLTTLQKRMEDER